MRRIFFLFLTVVLINSMSYDVYGTIPDIDLVGEGAILIEKDSEKVLFEKNMNQRMYPASTTKIVTALVALEYGQLDEVITVGSEIDEIPWYSNSANLVAGDELTLHHLLYGLLLPSGNDAANTIARHISEKVSGKTDISLQEAHEFFSGLMNQKTEEIGAKNTNFINPHGFHHEDQYTTPWDMAIIGKYAMENDIFSRIVGATEARYYNDEVWETTNYLIAPDSENYYPYATGIKTGNTAASGKCLVSSASKNNLELIAVVLNSTDNDIWPDTISMFDYGFENIREESLPLDEEKVKPEEDNLTDYDDNIVEEEVIEEENQPIPWIQIYGIIIIIILISILIIRNRRRITEKSK